MLLLADSGVDRGVRYACACKFKRSVLKHDLSLGTLGSLHVA